MRGFLITLSGARPEILEKCETERGKFEGIGGAVLTTSVLATASMWFALTTALGINGIVAVLPAVAWGLAIMSLDRWLVGSIPAEGRRRWALATPRILMAVLLGVVISTPLVLQIFRSEIDAQIVVIKQRRANDFLKQQQRNQVGQEVAKWRNNVASLQKTITSDGSVPVNAAADPRIQALTKSRGDAQKLADKHYKEWQCQLYGGEGCTKKGNGPLAKASKSAYDKDVGRINDYNRQIETRRKQLTATDEASKKVRLQEAKDALPKAKEQLDVAVQRQSDLQARFDAENKATNGLLIRLQALDEVSGHNFTLNGARILLFLLFLLIECLPVSVKLMQRPGSYEKILRLATDKELREARAGYIGGRRGGSRDGETLSLRDTSIREIWHSRQPVRERSDLDHSADAGAGADQSDTGEHTTLDHVALQNMQDTRSVRPPGSPVERNSGAIELYGDDDEF
jgi:uncharacterized protein DUF4407